MLLVPIHVSITLAHNCYSGEGLLKSKVILKNEEGIVNSFETRSWRRMLKIKWTDRITNDEDFRRAKEERLLFKILKNRRPLMDRAYG